MFDLFRQEKTKKYVMGGILVLVSASMLLYLVPSYNTGTTAGGEAILATIGKDQITETEARQEIEREMKGKQIPAQILPNYVPTMVEGMITDRALEYEAHKLGIVVSDQDVAEILRTNYGGLFQDGKFIGKDAYAQMLAQQGTTIEVFEADLKRQLLTQMLRKIASEAAIVTPAEIEKEYQKRNEQIQLQYVKVTQDKFKKEAEPTNEEMLSYFNTNKGAYTVPESKSLVVLVADESKIEAGLNPTDAQLQMVYNQNLANFRMPERVQERHILLLTQGKPPADEAKIKAKAEDLVKQLRAGADFAELAKKNSEDPGSGAKGGDLGWVTRGQMVPEFEKASFELKPMVISDPVKTQYGYHIIQVMAHEPARVKPFAEVKDDLAKQWKQQRAGELMQKISDTAQAVLSKDPDHPDKIAADLGMQVVHVDNYIPGQPVPEVGGSADFDQAVSGLKKGGVSQAVAPAANKIVVAEVTGITPPRPATFDEVKTRVHDTMAASKLSNLLRTKANELDEAAKKDGDLAKAAKAMGLEVKTTEPFKQGATVDGLGSANYVEDAFKDPVGTVLNPVPLPDGTLIAKVVQVLPADMSKLPEERDKIRESIKGEKWRDRNTEFESGLVLELEKKGVIKVHQDAITRLIAGFRSGS